MSRVYGEPYTHEHLQRLDMRDYERAIASMDRYAALAGEMATSAAIIADGNVIGIMGMTFIWSGVIEVFLLPSNAAPQYALEFVRYVRRTLDNLFNDTHAHRMFTYSRADEQTDKWMRALGFELEGTLRQHTQTGEDYRVWARVK